MAQTEVFPLTMFAHRRHDAVFVAADDLLTMFIALEVFSLPLYLMCGLARRRRLLSQESALKYFLLGAFSSAFFLYGIALLYGYAGTLSLTGIAHAIDTNTDNTTLALIGAALVAVGVLFKVGAVPFHSWIPDVYQGAPTPITAFMAAATKVAAFGAMLRIFYVALPGLSHDWRPVLWAVAILTMVVGHRHRGDPDRRQTDAGVFGCRTCRIHPHRGHRRQRRRPVGHAVLSVRLRVLPPWALSLWSAWSRDAAGDEETDDGPLGRAGSALSPCRRGVLTVPARLCRYPAHQRIRQQVRGVQGRRGKVGRIPLVIVGVIASGDRRLLLRAADRADVLHRSARGRPGGRHAQFVDRRDDHHSPQPSPSRSVRYPQPLLDLANRRHSCASIGHDLTMRCLSDPTRARSGS